MSKTIAVLGLIAIGAYALFRGEPEEEKGKSGTESLLTVNEYRAGYFKAAEEGGKKQVEEYREENLGVIGEFTNEHFDREHDEMLRAITAHEYTACVIAYKGCHEKPADGWGEAYSFCQNAITNYKSVNDLLLTKIVEQGHVNVVTLEGVVYSSPDGTHPVAYDWIIKNTGCTSEDSPHYRDYERGYRDAVLQGWHHPRHTEEQFKEKVMEYAGMKKSWLGLGDEYKW